MAMSLVDAFKPEERFNITYSELYALTREAAKAELILNAVNCDVPHAFIREMATGKKEDTPKTADQIITAAALKTFAGIVGSEINLDPETEEFVKNAEEEFGKWYQTKKEILAEARAAAEKGEEKEERDPDAAAVEEEQNREGEKEE